MRRLLVLAPVALSACGEADRAAPTPTPSLARDPTSDEERARIAPRGEAATVLRSGRQVPIRLPRGFTLYPGAEVVANSLVEREGSHRSLLVFETPDPLEKVMLFYRAQAQSAGARVSLDLGGEARASLGGVAADGRNFAVAGRRLDAATRVELSLD